MARNFNKAERYVKQDEEYKLLSYATSSESVEMTDGTDLQTKVNNIDKSISDEVTRATNAENNLDSKKSNINSPTFTGTPKAPTASAGTNTTQIATTAFVQTAVANLVDSAPETMNTLDELSQALGDDPNFATTVANQIGTKANSSDLTAHTGNKSNPHGVTKSQVGLGNVPNVATNDQTPTFTEATTLAKLSSGEKLSVAFGKISKAITDLIAHVGDTVKHITSAERTNWNSAKTHADSAHAPSNAQANVIESVKVNGTAITPSSKSVNVVVPTKLSDLSNDSGFITASDVDTSQNHTHTNKSVLDAITASYTTEEKTKLSGIANGANNYSLPLMTSSVRGGAKIGYSQNGKNYPVQLSNEQMYVNVPWTDNNTTYGVVSTSANGLCPKRDGSTSKFLRGDGTWAIPPSGNGVVYSSTEPTSLTPNMVWIG